MQQLQYLVWTNFCRGFADMKMYTTLKEVILKNLNVGFSYQSTVFASSNNNRGKIATLV